MSERTSNGKTTRLNERLTRISGKEKSLSSTRTRVANQLVVDKENRPTKDSESSIGSISILKARYEEMLNSRPKNFAPSASDNNRFTGAIKKRVDASSEKTIGIQKSVGVVQTKYFVPNKRADSVEEKKFGAQKRVDNSEEECLGPKTRVAFAPEKKRTKFDGVEFEGFGQSRFEIYADDQAQINPVSVTDDSIGKYYDGRAREQKPKGPMPELGLTSHQRFTPIDVGIPLIPKKVKVQHRTSSRIENGKPDNLTGSVAQYSNFRLPYEHNFIDLEVKREGHLSKMSKGLRKQNMTDEQRKIIVKFLIRLNAHSFYPSFLLHQTVRIFDAFLDMKLISIEEMQLVALASMWIALKREQIAYRIPSGAEMISYSKDLYEGRVDLLRRCEREILQALNFEMVFPDVFSILCYYLTTCKRSQFLPENQVELAYYCGSYMLDLALFDEDLLNRSMVLIAAAAAEAALFFVTDGEKCNPRPWWFEWRAPDAATRYGDVEIGDVRSALIRRVNESNQRHSDGALIFKKYSRSRYGRVSHYLCEKVRLFVNVN